MTDTMSIAEFVAKHTVSMFVEAWDRNPNMGDDDWSRTASHWRCLLRCGKRTMTVYFSQGSAHTNPPTVDEVLDSIASDARGVVEQDFRDWCGDYGYDTDSIKALKTFKACQKIADKLRRFLPSFAAFAELMDCESL
jgi:hypothetical protein